MSAMKKTKPKLFLLDDSSDLVAQVSRIADRLGWEIHCAHSVEGAVKLAKRVGGKVDVALIDLMIPETENELECVNKLLEQRNKESRIITQRGQKAGSDEQGRQAARLKLDVIDKSIMELIADDGGVRFLNKNNGGNFFSKPGVKVAIFSARRPDLPMEGNGKTLKAFVADALGKDPEEWFEKPVSPFDFEQWLAEQSGKVR